MKILLLANSLDNSCGVSSHLFILAKGLINSGINFAIVSGGGNSVQKFLDLGIEVKIIPELRHERRSLINFLLAELKLFSYIRWKRFGIIHSHHHYASNLARVISKILGNKSIQTIHGILPPTGRLPHFSADYFIAVEDHISEYLVAIRKIKSDRVKLICNGTASKNPGKRINNGRIRFLAAARMVEEKYLHDFLFAANSLDEKCYAAAEFELAGSGELKEKLITINEVNGGRVKIIDEIKELSDEFYKYDAFVHCSGKEGLPMSLLEAALSKCMIITSDYDGRSRFLTSENGAGIYNTGNYRELKNIIQHLIRNPQMIIGNAEKMFLAVKDVFNASRMINETVDYYKHIMDGG